MSKQVNGSFLLYWHLGMCSSPCVSGVCTAKDKCTCDRGFEGSSCNETATEGKLTNAFLCERCGSFVVSALVYPPQVTVLEGSRFEPEYGRYLALQKTLLADRLVALTESV